MNQNVIISLIYMGTCAVLSMVQSILSSYNYPIELLEIARSLGMAMPTLFLSALLVEWLWKDGAGWTYFQRVFYRVLIFTLMMMVVRTALDFMWQELMTDVSGSFGFIEHFLYSFHYAFLSAALYYVVRSLFVQDGNGQDKPKNKFDSNVIDQ
ncbi:MAG: hypothetical protein ACHQF2_08985 [Flavobacteriales bacterium]